MCLLMLCMCRKIVEAVLRLQEAGLPIPEDLLPKKKEKKPKAEKGDKKKK